MRIATCAAFTVVTALCLADDINDQSLADPPDAQGRFSEHLISNNYTYAFGVAAADLDGDGDLDLTSADALPHNALYWFENDGQGNFSRHFIQQNDPERLERHAIADVNGDGRPDVVIVENLYGDLKWFENSGTPRDGKLWKRHYITQRGFPSAYDVAPADLDGDGDLDIAASNWNRGAVAWFENDGSPNDEEEWKQHKIDDALGEARTIRTADFDRDGDLDLLATGRTTRQTVWYENVGKPQASEWKKHVIDDQSKYPTHGQPADMDGDGDLDVVLARGFGPPFDEPGVVHQVVWYENNGQPASGPWNKHAIAPLPQAFEAFAADLDGDGDLDVAATGWSAAGSVIWIENTGDPRGAWKTHVLKDKWTNANQIIAADLDGDGDLDLAACAERGALELRWWRNEGSNKMSEK